MASPSAQATISYGSGDINKVLLLTAMTDKPNHFWAERHSNFSTFVHHTYSVGHPGGGVYG